MNTQTQASIVADHLVGNLWYNLDYVPVLAGLINPDDVRFAVGGNSAIAYSEMCRLLRTVGGLNAGSLEAGLKMQGFDFGWLTQLQSRITVEPLQTICNYAGEIANAAELKRMQTYCADAIQRSKEDGANAGTIGGDLLAKLAGNQSSVAGAQSVATIADGIKAELELIRKGEYNFGLETGFKTLDNVFRMQDGDLITIAARPSQGKTSLARQIVYNVANRIHNEGENEQVVMFTADDTPKKVLYGLASAVARVDLNVVRSNRCPKGVDERFDRALDYIAQLPIVIDGKSKPTVDEMYYRCAMLNAQKRVRLACMDYMQLISDDKAHSETQEAKRAASGCKGIGHTLGFPFLLVSQVRKESESRANKWLTPSDLLYAGEAESDVCLLLVRPEHYIARGENIECAENDKQGIVLVNVGKNKQGSIGMVRMQFAKEFSAFADPMLPSAGAKNVG